MQRMRLLDLIHNLLAVSETAVYLEYCITNEELNYEYWLVPTFSSVPSLHQEVNEMLIFFLPLENTFVWIFYPQK